MRTDMTLLTSTRRIVSIVYNAKKKAIFDHKVNITIDNWPEEEYAYYNSRLRINVLSCGPAIPLYM